MKAFTLIISIIFIIFGCIGDREYNLQGNNRPTEKTTKKNTADKRINEETKRDEFYGFDTLLIDEYRSESGHKIKSEGSQSKDIYRISVESKKGRTKKFQTANDWYRASHSTILWDNEDYVFVRYGCGTMCWGGLLLSLHDNREIADYPGYIYEDSIRNLIVYPNPADLNQIIIENFDKQKRIFSNLNLCKKSVVPMQMIDTVYLVEENLTVRYRMTDCKSKEILTINIAETEN